jgi:hypothetical protein
MARRDEDRLRDEIRRQSSGCSAGVRARALDPSGELFRLVVNGFAIRRPGTLPEPGERAASGRVSQRGQRLAADSSAPRSCRWLWITRRPCNLR